jgi:ABC-type sugar transport system ATPase subunit
MSYLQISGLKISYGDKVVLHNIDLGRKGEMIALLGVGLRKNHTAECALRFIPVQSGEIAVAHRDITHSAGAAQYHHGVSKLRLWPHLTVARNIGYGLKLRKWRGTILTAGWRSC